MKEGIHPEWFAEATVVCACGNSWTTGATVSEIRTDVCSACHPFYTGEQRIVDTEGQVDRFLKRLKARENIIATRTGQPEEEDATPEVEPEAVTEPVVEEVIPEPEPVVDAVVEEPEIAEVGGADLSVALDTFGIGTRSLNALADAGINTAGDFIGSLEQGGDAALLGVKGFGAKSLEGVKETLLDQGYVLP